jgi:hypothetical protein
MKKTLLLILIMTVSISGTINQSQPTYMRNPFEYGKASVAIPIQKIIIPVEELEPNLIKQAPIKPPEKPKEKPPELVLNGIFSSKGKVYVLINQEIRDLGDSIKDWTITKIDEKSVTLIKGKEKKVLIVN